MTTWYEKYIAFIQSDVIKTYKENYSSFKILSIRSLHKHYCKCVINPSLDIIKLSLYYYIISIFKEITHNKLLYTQLSIYNCFLHSKLKEKEWITLLNVPIE